jgi:DNA-binding NtrC family response regulator/predicted TIM-barrel enzyme
MKSAEDLRGLLDGARHSRLPLIFVVPGSGQIARYAVEGGAHFIMVLNAGLYRSTGVSSLASFLPFGNANDQIDDLLCKQIIPRAKHTPIVAGLMANDPVVPFERRLKRMQGLGIAGVANWPAVGFIDGKFRSAIAEEGFSIESEIAMLSFARSMGFVTFGYALSDSDAAIMAESGVDCLVLNLGWTHESHDIFQKGDRIQHAVVRVNEMIEAVERTGCSPIYLFFGGSITLPEDSAELYRRTKVHGYGGGSSFERIPVERLIINSVKQFCSVPRQSERPLVETASAGLVGTSPIMLQLKSLIKKIALYDVSVCIQGETGVGKELVALELHRSSHRASQPFITLNCGAMPDTLVEAELFGNEKGAFTGAVQRRLGKFELADKGTLFLDEVAELSPKAQVSLLRVLQQKEISRIGGEKAITVDVRIVAATHNDLNLLVSQGKFRADLYFRLNLMTLKVPSLRSHPEDIPLLVDTFLGEFALQFGKNCLGVTPDFINRLMAYSWPGNIRELKHVLCRSILLEDDPVLSGRYFDSDGRVPAPTAEQPGKNAERETLINVLERVNQNRSKAAKEMGISRKTLYDRMKRLEIGRRVYKTSI